MDYKNTLLLPNTAFAMRANLSEEQPKRFKKWSDNKIYEKMKANRKNATKNFNIHDGPPYANGHIHIGHSLNKILKDMITKTHYFMGDSVRYTPGWDCHGLPIEQQVEVKFGDKKKDMSKSAIRNECRKWADEFIQIQKEEFKNLGVLGDWENPYLTMKFKFEASIYRTLCEVAKKGLLVERSKPVFWSWAARSALAEAEVEYQDKEDYSLFLAFDLDKNALDKLGVKTAKAVIWTTTPWTLAANQAISLKPDTSYVLTSENYIFAKELLENLKNQAITKGEVIKEFVSDELENLHAINPLNGRKSMFILGEHVLMDGGTGLVHTAPGHGEDDYFVSLKYGLEVIMPVDETGCYDEVLRNKKLIHEQYLDEFVGLHIFKANEKIIEILKDNIVWIGKFIHSYPYCWRTHKPVIYRATKQWFIAMDEPKLSGGQTLRQAALKALESVKFYPQSGIKRIGSMIENRPDWCISRQRDWGVPIAFFRDKTTKEPIFDHEIMENIASIFEQKGADAWWDLEIAELLPKNTKFNPQNLEKVNDILDVWFDSGSTWNAVLKSDEYDSGEYVCDMYLEGSDQHRGWFQSSLLLSVAVNETAPYKSIVTHGFTMDSNGNKMSKSKGNVVAPNDVAKKFGVEILRLWVGMSDYSGDQKIGDDILKQISEQYRKIRNTIRFLLANIDDFDGQKAELNMLDKWILTKATKTFKEVEICFREYDFSKGFNILLNFLTGDLSGIYLDICKDRLYCDTQNSTRRRSAQFAMFEILKSILTLIAPVLTYTADEAVEAAPNIFKGKDIFDFTHKSLEYDFEIKDEILISSREKFNEIVDQLKKDKIIKSTLELVLQTSSNEILSMDKESVSDWFMVSNLENLNPSGEEIAKFDLDNEIFRIIKSDSHKCPRCWKFVSQKEDKLCDRCQKVINV